jgi:hypothetical protein
VPGARRIELEATAASGSIIAAMDWTVQQWRAVRSTKLLQLLLVFFYRRKDVAPPAHDVLYVSLKLLNLVSTRSTTSKFSMCVHPDTIINRDKMRNIYGCGKIYTDLCWKSVL